jgi:hypothetical protein
MARQSVVSPVPPCPAVTNTACRHAAASWVAISHTPPRQRAPCQSSNLTCSLPLNSPRYQCIAQAILCFQQAHATNRSTASICQLIQQRHSTYSLKVTYKITRYDAQSPMPSHLQQRTRISITEVSLLAGVSPKQPDPCRVVNRLFLQRFRIPFSEDAARCRLPAPTRKSRAQR